MLEQSTIKRLDLIAFVIFDVAVLELPGSKTGNRQTYETTRVYVIRSQRSS